MSSTLTKNQKKVFKTIYNGGKNKIKAIARFDDPCGNGHNTFSLTGQTWAKDKYGLWSEEFGGCIHEEISEVFPELASLTKWHLCSTDGPLHYLANTIYLAGNRDCWGLQCGEIGKHGRIGDGKRRELKAARRSAIWPDATDKELMSDDLKDRLIARLPALLAEFRKDMEGLGFTW